jgi:hypothetical protein
MNQDAQNKLAKCPHCDLRLATKEEQISHILEKHDDQVVAVLKLFPKTDSKRWAAGIMTSAFD